MMARKTTVILNEISSAIDPTLGTGGKRDDAIDLTPFLETSEVVSSVSITSSDESLLKVSNAAKNTAVITKEDGGTIAIGKGVQFQLATQKEVTERDLHMDMYVVGDSGSAETYDLQIKVVDKKRS